MTLTGFEKGDLFEAMTELARRLRGEEVKARICVIGGAPRAMRYYDRGAPRQGLRDIDYLITECKVASYDEAEEIFEEFYPGEVMKPRARGPTCSRSSPDGFAAVNIGNQ